jgi:hypothetical protein
MLSVGKRGARVVLWTETGILPIRYRRLLLALSYLLYIVRNPGERWVWKALRAAVTLDFRGRPNWVSDLRKVLRGLPFPCSIPTLEEWTDPRVVEELMKEVRKGALTEIQREFDGSSKLYLLHGRLDNGEEEGRRKVVVTSKLRDYLRLENPNHRKAFTRILVSAHMLAVEIYQYAKAPVPRKERVCRFGCGEVETPEHIWLGCRGNDALIQLRSELQRKIVVLCSEDELVGLMELDDTPALQLKTLLGLPQCVATLAEYAYEIEKILKKCPLEWL